MVVVECSAPGCTFKTGDVSEALAIALLTNHGLAHPSAPPVIAPPPQAPAPQGPKLDRPRVDVGVSIEEWNVFIRRWDVFRTGSGIGDAQAPFQFFQCAGPELGDSLLKANPTVATGTLPNLIAAMRSLAVIPVATCVLRTELLQLRQERDETFRAFTARVRGKAETCAYVAACGCGEAVDYTDHIIRDVLINGIYDSDIRREALGTPDILKMPVNDVVALAENKEMARNALPSSALSAVLSSQRLRKAPQASPTLTPYPADKTRVASCPECKGTFNVFTEGPRGWNTKPHQLCIDCFRARRRRRRPQASAGSQQAAMELEPISQNASLQSSTRPGQRRGGHANTPVILEHHIFSKGEWRRARTRDHPRAPITISMDSPVGLSGQGSAGVARISAIADTGAQSDLWSLTEFLACGFSRDDLRPVRLNMSAANHSPIAVEGAFFARLSTTSGSGEVTSCRSMVYVSSSVQAMYLSYDSLLNLGLLPRNFPSGDIGRGPEDGYGPDIPNTPCHPLPSSPPSTPFEAVFADFFDYGGRRYLVVGDRLSGWVEVLCSTAGSDMGGSAGLVRHLRSFFGSFGVPEELSSDGGPEFMAGQTQDFLRLWDVKHRVSSVAFPQSNGRAEVAVKTAKRILMSNTGPTGSLDRDRFLRAMLQLRNTPDPDCNLSPAQIIYGRPLRGPLSFVNKLEKFTDSRVRPLWRQAWAAKEDALRTRMSRTTESLRTHSRPLRPLAPGARVFLQNQQGPSPTKWDRSGVVVESLGHDQYRVKVDGSGRLTLRNRRFLRGYTPATPYAPQQPVAPLPPPMGPDCLPLPFHPDPVVPRGIPLLSGDGPDEAGLGSSPPLMSDGPASDLMSQGDPVPSAASPRVARSPPSPPPSVRPCRSRRPPKRYEPETGHWTLD